MSCESNCGPLTVTLLTGAPGVQGTQGVQGPAGPAGPQGPQGPAGSVGTVTGDMSITTEGVATLATVGVAAVVGGAAKALTLQVDEKGRVLAVTAQDASITTSQVQNLSLATLGGVSTTDPRLSDSRTPSGAAGGDLAGTYPAPTLALVGTAGVTGEADKTLVLQTDAKGRTVAVTAQAISITTGQVQDLSLATLGGVSTTDPRLSDARTPSGAAGGDLAGTYPNPTLSTVTTAGSAGSETVVPVVTIDAKGRVTALGSAQIAALTTAQVAGLSTTTPAAIATTGSVGVEMFAARADHVHALTTLGVPGTFGSASAVPIVTVDAFGRVASVTTAGITGGGGASLTTADAAPLGALASAGISSLAARGDHIHPLPTAAQVGAIATTGTVKLSINTALTTTAGINLAPLAVAPAGPIPGDIWVRSNVLEFAGTGSTVSCIGSNQNNTYGGIQTFQNRITVTATSGSAFTVTQGGGGTNTGAIVTGATNSGVPLMRVTQTGAGDALVVEDAANPDSTPFTVNAAGRVGIGLSVATTETAALTVDAGGIKFADGSVQTAFLPALTTAQVAGLSTSTPAVLATTGAVGTSLFAARADHVHALTTLGIAGTFGSGSAVPVVTVDAFGRVASVTTAAVSSAGVTTSGLAPLDSPALTGTPTAPTASAGTNSTQIATTAFVASNSGDRYKTTSDSTATIGNGTKTFSVASGLSYSPTQDVTVIADVDNHMHGTVVSYSGTTLVVEVAQHTGSGTFSSWTINVGGLTTAAGALLASNNLSDVSNIATARTNLGAVSTARQVSAGTGLSGGGDLTADRTLSLAASGVVAGDYGGASAVPVLTVDTYGRLTSVTTAQAAALTTNDIRGLSTVDGAALTTAGVVGLSLFAARADHSHKFATVYARTKTVGVDAATIQGCIDLITDASATNQAQVVVPPGYYVENLTLKPCVSVVASGTNNGQISTVRIVGNATFTGGATAADNTLQLVGLSLNTNHATLPALTVAASGGVTTLLLVQDCMVTSSNAASTAIGIQVGTNCSVRLVNVRTQGNTTAGQGGTHVDVDGGTFYAENWTTEFGTRALLLRGTNGALKPYGELKWCNILVAGSNAIEITSSTALLTMGWVSVGNLATTGNGINVAAGSVVGATQCVFAVQAGASNYVVTGAAGSYYYSLGNSYSNATGVSYETKIGALVTQFQYARSYDPASGDLTGSFPAPTLAAVTTAQSNVGSATVIPRLSIDAKGRVTALSTVAVSALTTAQLSGLSTATPAVLATSGTVGTSLFAARADHVHALSTIGVAGTFGSASAVPVVTVDAFGRVASVTTAGIPSGLSLTTADAAPLGAVASAGVSTLAARGDHVHPLPTAAQIGALTTAQIQSLSTSTPAAIATAGVVGLSVYPARQDHQHALATIGTPGTFGSGSAVPVVTVDAFGRVASVTTAGITGGGGASLTTADAAPLGAVASAGVSTLAARGDHVHPFPTAAQIGALTTTQILGLSTETPAVLTTSGVVGVSTYAARADHSHAITTAATSPLFSASLPSALGSTASAGTAATVARSDHQHIYPTPAEIGAIATTGTVALSINTSASRTPPLKLTAISPTGAMSIGHIWLDTGFTPYALSFYSSGGSEQIATQNRTNTFLKSQIFSPTDTVNAAIKIIQTASQDCLRVEDSASPDATPFVIDASGRVGVGVAPDATAAITLDGGGIKIANAAATAFCTVTVGAGSPEGVVTAGPGSLYLNTSGGSGTSLYVKESGSGNTGWVGK